ncbi:hypothetical protein BV22DRAFT_1036536 [Leucogyrophana mollusca]|uniref:Uncharacterized protein n=1 Tax=Leucogyrophana mollusca TaxID=85980 RepID=A0ACB8BCQ5_9AGAM|nr:hypothetical protein BV22DRAFT_1036536 [Leucogyrophana mollusca]
MELELQERRGLDDELCIEVSRRAVPRNASTTCHAPAPVESGSQRGRPQPNSKSGACPCAATTVNVQSPVRDTVDVDAPGGALCSWKSTILTKAKNPAARADVAQEDGVCGMGVREDGACRYGYVRGVS